MTRLLPAPLPAEGFDNMIRGGGGQGVPKIKFFYGKSILPGLREPDFPFITCAGVINVLPARSFFCWVSHAESEVASFGWPQHGRADKRCTPRSVWLSKRA